MNLTTKRGGKRKAQAQEINDDEDENNTEVEQQRLADEKAARKAKAAALSAKSKGSGSGSSDMITTEDKPVTVQIPKSPARAPAPVPLEEKVTAKPVQAGFSVDIGVNSQLSQQAQQAVAGAAKPLTTVAVQPAHIKLSRIPEEQEVKNLLAAYSVREWTDGIADTNPNIALAGAYEYRYMPNCNPTKEMFFSVEKPGVDKPQAFKGKRKNKRPRREYDPDAIFVNLRFKCEPKVLQCTLVWPISRVMMAELQAGNYSGVPSNEGRQYMKDKFTDARKKILLTPEYFEVAHEDAKTKKITTYAPTKHELKDAKGQVIGLMNGDFLAALARDQEMAMMMCEMVVTEHPGLVVTEKAGKPAYLAMVEDEVFGSQIGKLQSNYQGGCGPWDMMLAEGKITQAEHTVRINDCKAKNFIGEDGLVDEVKLKASVPKIDLAKKLMAKCYTSALKKSKTTGIQFVVFETKVTRNSTKDEQEKRPVFQNAVEEAIYNASKGKKMYNQHTFTNLEDWSKPAPAEGEELKVLTEEERAIQAIKLYDRMLDSGSKAGIVYTLRFFFDAPTGTIGFAREFHEILFLAPPSKEDLAKIGAFRSQSVFKPAAGKVTWVPGASKFTTTEITNDTEEIDLNEVTRNVQKSIADAEAQRAAKKAGKKA